MASVKVSLSVDEELLVEARQYAGDNLSAWVNEAMGDRVRLERARRFLEEEAAERGPLPPDLVAEVGAAWPG